MSDQPSDLVLTGLTKRFSTAEGDLDILSGVDLSLSRGDALAVTGPSGSGKSTLLYIIGVLDEPTAGTVSILGTDPFALGSSDQASFRNQRIGFVFQDHHLLPQCTVLENVLLPKLAGTGVDKESTARAEQLLERVGLQDRRHHRPARISGGERQRVAVCRALINQPELLLADEPTGNLDQARAGEVGELLLELAREQNTLLMCVTHSLELASKFPLHRVLHQGRLVEPAAISAEPVTQ